MNRKLFPFLRTTLLALLLTAGASAYGFKYIYKGVKFKCEIQNGNVVTIKMISPNAKVVHVPAEVVDGKTGRAYPVKIIDTFSQFVKPNTETLKIEEGVEIIRKNAFLQCRKLKVVSLPNSIRKIEKNAFKRMKDKRGIIYQSKEIGEMLEASGIYYYYLAGPALPPAEAERAEKPREERPQRFMTSQPVSADSLPVVKVVSFKKVDGSLGAHTNYRLDYSEKLCALVKVTLVGYDADYSGDYIPEPRLNFIAFNKEGKDFVWLTEKATGMNIYSPNKAFEPRYIDFKTLNPDIPFLESGNVYELNVRIVNVSKDDETTNK